MKITPNELQQEYMALTGDQDLQRAAEVTLDGVLDETEMAEAYNRTLSPTGPQWTLTPNASVKEADILRNTVSVSPPSYQEPKRNFKPLLPLLAIGVGFYFYQKRRGSK